jgi:hypothetical protein
MSLQLRTALCVSALVLAPSLAGAAAAGLFLTPADLQQLRNAAQTTSDADLRASYNAQASAARSALGLTADPFTMTDISSIVFHWCSEDTDGIDNSLWDATNHFTRQSHSIRALALQYALTTDRQYADKAVALMKAWSASHTPVNIYDFDPDFLNATIDGMTQDYCSERPWNFALDAMWQAYGLTNVGDAYILLTRNGYTIPPTDDAAIRQWIIEVAQAVNSSYHAWTKWADLHPRSSSFVRYRNDNHLSWSMLGLLAAGVALDDQALVAYVLEGGAWNDGRSGLYANPSPILTVLDGAIEASGRVYEERINRDPPIGYSFFHLWPMLLIARIDEVLGPDRVHEYKGQDGAGLREAMLRYVPYILGTPVAGGEGNMTTHAWLYYLAQRWWPNETAFDQAQARGAANQIISQSLGPVLFMIKGLPPPGADQKRPMPPELTILP